MAYTYTDNGNLATRTWARGVVTTYSYDGWNNLTNTAYSDGTPSITFVYDALGRQISAIDAVGTTTTTYDDFGEVASESVSGLYSRTLSHVRDDFGRDLGYTLDNSRKNIIEYEPDTARIKRVMFAGAWYTYGYLPGTDLKSSLTVGTAGRTDWTYEPSRDLLTQVKNTAFGSVVSQYDYVNDAIGRRTEISRSGTRMTETRSDAYGYNDRNELTNAVKNATLNEYAYHYDDIGNRLSSLDLGEGRQYESNNLNQYVSIAESEDEFTPQFDDDGNQTLVKTSTGVWSVTYNGENRPVLWSCGATNITMKYDRMGRRVEYVEMMNGNTNTHHRFVYDGYLCVQRLNGASNNAVELAFGWDPTEPVATRPLWMQRVSGTYNFFYFHDGNKNVSELVSYQTSRGVPAHYEYAPFGTVTAATTNTVFTAFNVSEVNPYRFSSEYSDDALGLVYYNYRHYDSALGRWLVRDPIGESVLPNIYGMCFNQTIFYFDVLGLKVYWSTRDLDSFFLGNHHFITFAYDDPEDAPTELRSRLIKVTCKNCKTKYVMFMGLARLSPVTENVERNFLGIKWQTTEKKCNIGVYHLDANNFQSSDHKNDLQAYKEDFCKERGACSDFDYDAHEIIGYSDENKFVSELLKLYQRSAENLKNKPVEYDLRKCNCATWVNCILKEAGISDDYRTKLNWDGIDWGEGQETLEEWFK